MEDVFRILQRRNLALLMSGRFVSSAGDWLYQIALSIVIFRYSHGMSVFLGLFWVVRLLPNILLGPASASVANRIGYRRSVILSDLARAVLIAGLAVVLSNRTWAIVFPFVFLVTCFGSLFRPGHTGMIRSLAASREERTTASAALLQIDSVAWIAGSAVGGVIAGMGHIKFLLLAEAATFAFSALTMLFIRSEPSTSSKAPPTAHPLESRPGFVPTLRLLFRRPLVVFAALIMLLPEFASGALVVWLVPYAEGSLHLGGGGLGYLFVALALGSTVGGFAAATLGSNTQLHVLVVLSVGVGGLLLVLFGLSIAGILSLVCLFVYGLGETVEYAAYQTLLRQAVPEHFVDHATSTLNTLFFNAMLLGAVSSGFLASAPGVRPALMLCGVVTIVVTAGAWMYLRISLESQPSARALAAVPAFADVAPEIREWAVRRLARERFPTGMVILRQGDEGDKLYMIAQGTAEAITVHGGRTISRSLGPGDMFGEIALLHRVPRTATIRASQPLTTWALTRDDFDELQARASEFRESLLDVAAARMERDARMDASLPVLT